MKAVQKKQIITNNKTQKLPKQNKSQHTKKAKEIDVINSVVYSEYDVWPILSEIYKHQN